jgi:glycosyltransferase involved in cell wall biosynthesis
LGTEPAIASPTVSSSGVEFGSDLSEIRVASVPSNHVYVRHLTPADNTAVVGAPSIRRLPDPDPSDPTRSTLERWWPPVMLEPDWVRNSDDHDVFHLQFGFDARTPEELTGLVESLRRRGTPLVYTVHDLRNPHHLDSSLHNAALDVLIPAADALITLTPGAADEISRRWGRDARVIPHPHVVDFETMARIQAERFAPTLEAATSETPTSETSTADEFRVGVHVKSLRASMNPVPVIRALIETVRDLPGAVLQINGHKDVLEASSARYSAELADLLVFADASGDLELNIHDFFSDADLWSYLSRLDVSVLPYRFGTHSGWLEACRDLGTTVVAPSCGYYRDQGPVLEYVHTEEGMDDASLRTAVETAYRLRPVNFATVSERRAQREVVAAAHLELYTEVLGMRR